MKKTTAYARKRRLKSGQYIEPGHSWISAIERCRPFDAEPVVPGFEGTDVNARAAALMVRESLDNLLSHQTPPADTKDFDNLAHAVDVAHVRALQIQEGEDNPMHAPLMAAKAAMKRVKERRESSGRWGLSGQDRAALIEAVALYQTILEASSPAQMDTAARMRAEWLGENARANRTDTAR